MRGEDARPVRGAQPGGVEEVLDREREPLQRPRLVVGVRLLGAHRLRVRPLEVERDERAELLAARHVVERLDGGELAAGERRP